VPDPAERHVASEQNKQELRDKVAALVAARFGSHYRTAFGHYDADNDGLISKDELKALLGEAGSAAAGPAGPGPPG
jgi:hypothetical protein